MTQQYQPPQPSPHQPPYGQQPQYPTQPPMWGQPAPGDYPQPGQAPQGYAPAPPAKKKRRKWPWVVGAIVLLFVVIGMSGGNSTPTTGSTQSGSASAAPAALAPAKAISARDWQLIAKDPAGHTGERVIVYGQVTQFDAATGTDEFRANVDGIEHKSDGGYVDYSTNTFLDGDTDALHQVVQGDLFKAEVTVTGAKSYDTTMGGSTTVPELTVTKIDVTGHAG